MKRIIYFILVLGYILACVWLGFLALVMSIWTFFRANHNIEVLTSSDTAMMATFISILVYGVVHIINDEMNLRKNRKK